ncbi:(2Fe-2S) ferredoxin domain-containing protein [Candidatus Woesearchaeota archaeon]|nr:(2Fe-2S) ferredoxin domain-containing protein [Candidatus Woesearchaeota archaeon]
MEQINKKYKHHIFVCINERDSGDCCAKRNSTEILRILREHINNNGLVHEFNVTKTKCLGHCAEGPTIVIYPEGVFFKKVCVDDTKKIIDEFLTL